MANGSSIKSCICHHVPLVLQEKDWDCGIACSKMVLQYLNASSFEEDKFASVCKQLGFDTSVWTIDIASIFNEYNIDHLMCTQTLGVDHTYETEAFYQNKSFSYEEKRINTLFKEAASLGMRIKKRSVDIGEIIKHLKAGNVIIILVDSNILEHHDSELTTNSTNEIIRNEGTQNQYQGHFIVVCGYNLDNEFITYRDPGCQGMFHSKFDNFDEARKAHGTDEDILFIYTETRT
ncbi:protein GUCD1-like isoform X2 [Antedon mediterranea]|uniref:protein GUCD1-like isoform X2 n=1 Tax=Antedon mediterranea TaxID=105859 RepID=UPI003AF474F8